jgi:hypothetical protein
VIMSRRIINNDRFLRSDTVSGGFVHASNLTHQEGRNDKLIEKIT